MKRMLRIGSMLAVLVATVVIAGGSLPPNAAAQAVDESVAVQAGAAGVLVSMVDDRFWPDALVIAAGTTVTWSNDESDLARRHNVIAERGEFASPDYYPGEIWSFLFESPGEYRYYCDLHDGMIGVVVVE